MFFSGLSHGITKLHSEKEEPQTYFCRVGSEGYSSRALSAVGRCVAPLPREDGGGCPGAGGQGEDPGH